MIVHHIATRDDWDARTDDAYAPAGFAAEGFVHCSFPDQVVATATTWFRGRRDLLVLTIDTELLSARIVVEDLHGHGDFPHIYGPVNLSAIVKARPLPVDDGATTRWS